MLAILLNTPIEKILLTEIFTIVLLSLNKNCPIKHPSDMYYILALVTKYKKIICQSE